VDVCQSIRRREPSKKPDQLQILNCTMEKLESEEFVLEEETINLELSELEKETSIGPQNQWVIKVESLMSSIMLLITNLLEQIH